MKVTLTVNDEIKKQYKIKNPRAELDKILASQKIKSYYSSYIYYDPEERIGTIVLYRKNGDIIKTIKLIPEGKK